MIIKKLGNGKYGEVENLREMKRQREVEKLGEIKENSNFFLFWYSAYGCVATEHGCVGCLNEFSTSFRHSRAYQRTQLCLNRFLNLKLRMFEHGCVL